MQPGKKKMRTTVILTAKNDAPALERTLQCFEQQTQAADEYVLAIADSTDNTLKIAELWCKQGPNRRLLTVGNANRSQGRNLAVDATHNEIVFFTDAGCLPHRNWIQELMQPFFQGASLVSGYTQVKNDSGWAEAQGAFILVPLQQIGPHPLPATRNMAIRKELFDSMGGFRSDLNFAEDYEFARRLEGAGYSSVFAPQARVDWVARRNLGEYFSMVSALTMGDMQASTWRLGHFTMWLRYGVLIVLGVWSWMLLQDRLLSGTLLAILYTAYLLFKVSRFRFSRRSSFFWAILLQAVTDLAVLSGTIRGLLRRKVNKRA